jgi:hypothetical protein
MIRYFFCLIDLTMKLIFARSIFCYYMFFTCLMCARARACFRKTYNYSIYFNFILVFLLIEFCHQIAKRRVC